MLLYQVTPGSSTPVVSSGSPVCGGSWFYGYQSVGAIYTVGDSNQNGAFAVGGSIASGCPLIDTSVTSNFDTCAIVEYFSGDTDSAP